MHAHTPFSSTTPNPPTRKFESTVVFEKKVEGSVEEGDGEVRGEKRGTD